MKIKKILFGSFLAVAMVGLLTACAPKKDANNSSSSSAKSSQTTKMTIGAMAAPDSAPLYVAMEKGYFKDEGLDVNIELFKDAIKRDAAVSAGKLDAAVTDLVMYTSYIKGKTGFKLGTALTGRFGVVTKDPNIKTWKDLEGKTVANFDTSITNYYLYSNMKKRHLENTTKIVKVPEIPTRLQVVADGGADSTIVPEPFLTMAKGKGLNVWGESDPKKFQATALALNKNLSNDEKTMTKFYKAYNKAVNLLNKDPQVVKDVIVKDLGMTQEVADAAQFPKFEKAKAVNEKTFKEVLTFAKEQKFFTQKINAKDYITKVKAN